MEYIHVKLKSVCFFYFDCKNNFAGHKLTSLLQRLFNNLK